MQDGGSAPANSRTTTGWVVGTTAPTKYATMEQGVERDTTALVTDVLPNANPNNTLGDGWRTENPITGVFANANWTITIGVRGESAGTSTHDGAIRVDVWKFANADGSSPTKLTSATLETSTYTNLKNNTTQTLTATWSPGGTVSFDNEYLFLQSALRHNQASAGSTADTHFYLGASYAYITTSDFTEPVTVDSGTHSHSATSAGVTIGIASGTHAHSAQNVDLGTAVTVNSATHAHSAPNVGVTIDVVSATQAQAADSAPVTIAVDNTYLAHAAQLAAVTASVNNTAHAHTVDNTPVTIGISSATQEQSAVAAAVTITVANAAHAHTADMVEPEALGNPVDSATHAHIADVVQVVAGANFATQAHAADTAMPLIDVAASIIEQYAAIASVIAEIQNSIQEHASTVAGVVASVADSSMTHTAQNVDITVAVNVDSAFMAHTVDNVDIIKFLAGRLTGWYSDERGISLNKSSDDTTLNGDDE